jgi:hypothetical protein
VGEETTTEAQDAPSRVRETSTDEEVQRDLSTSERNSFVCSWCAERFRTKGELLRHRLLNPDCSKNKNVSNPLPTAFMENPVVPGEHMLRRVRAGDCEHPTDQMKPWRDSDGEVRGLQCSFCYTIIPQE